MTGVPPIVDVNATALLSPLRLTLARKIHNLDDNSFTDHSPLADCVFPMRS
jgi:hypothetical protein